MIYIHKYEYLLIFLFKVIFLYSMSLKRAKDK